MVRMIIFLPHLVTGRIKWYTECTEPSAIPYTGMINNYFYYWIAITKNYTIYLSRILEITLVSSQWMNQKNKSN